MLTLRCHQCRLECDGGSQEFLEQAARTHSERCGHNVSLYEVLTSSALSIESHKLTILGWKKK